MRRVLANSCSSDSWAKSQAPPGISLAMPSLCWFEIPVMTHATPEISKPLACSLPRFRLAKRLANPPCTGDAAARRAPPGEAPRCVDQRPSDTVAQKSRQAQWTLLPTISLDQTVCLGATAATDRSACNESLRVQRIAPRAVNRSACDESPRAPNRSACDGSPDKQTVELSRFFPGFDGKLHVPMLLYRRHLCQPVQLAVWTSAQPKPHAQPIDFRCAE
jgi:hypothetical protein